MTPYYLVLMVDITVGRMLLRVVRNDGDGDTPVHSAPVIQGKEYAKLAKWHTPI